MDNETTNLGTPGTEVAIRDPKTGRYLPGHPKAGGATRGATKFNWIARSVMESKGVHPLALALDVVLTGLLPAAAGEDPAKRKPVSAEERLRMLRTCLEYALPKLSAVTLTSHEGGPVALATFDITQIMMNPELADAAQKLALAMATQEGIAERAYGQPGSPARALLDGVRVEGDDSE